MCLAVSARHLLLAIWTQRVTVALMDKIPQVPTTNQIYLVRAPGRQKKFGLWTTWSRLFDIGARQVLVQQRRTH
jgi:hypothetical protein